MKVVNIIIVCIVSLLLSAGCASAVPFGASPATLTFDLLKGGSGEQILTASTASEEPLSVAVSISDNLKDFISYGPSSNLKVDVNNPLEITIRARAPRFAKAGIHDGAITVSTAPSASSAGGTGSAIATGVAIRTIVKIGQPTATASGIAGVDSSGSAQSAQDTIPLSSGSSSGSMLVVFVVILILGSLAIVAVKVLKRRRKGKTKK